MRLENKVALISGGARGMGAEEARLFAAEGATVVIGDILEDEGRRTEAEINEAGGECLYIRLDVTSESSWQEAVAATVARFGKLDIVVNNAGIGGGGRLEDTTVEEWDRVMAVNAKGVFLGTKAAIPEMRRAGGGSIINISSQLGLVGTDNSSPQYQASKGAVRLLTKATAIQYAGEGIRCNSVHPGSISTPMVHAALEELAGIKLLEQDDPEATRIAMGIGEPSDVANLVLYLVSDESKYMTGAELVLDNGVIVGQG